MGQDQGSPRRSSSLGEEEGRTRGRERPHGAGSCAWGPRGHLGEGIGGTHPVPLLAWPLDALSWQTPWASRSWRSRQPMAALEGQRRGLAEWRAVAKGHSLLCPCSQGWTGPCLGTHPGRTRGPGGHVAAPHQGAAPHLPPSRTLPARQGGPAAPRVLAVPVETKPVLTIPSGLASVRFGGTQPPP